MEHSTYGRHVVVDAWECDDKRLNDHTFLREEMVKASEACGATVLSVQDKRFQPEGLTILVLLSESHLSIHTYPEKSFAALDCYTCGETVDPQIAIDHMVGKLGAKRTHTQRLIRGIGEIQVRNVKR